MTKQLYRLTGGRWESSNGGSIAPPFISPMGRVTTVRSKSVGAATPPPQPPSSSRDLLVYGDYAPGPTTTGPVSGTVFTVYGTGPSYQGRPISDYDDPDCPHGVVPNAADWSNGSDYRMNATSNGQVIENIELWGSIDLRGFSNVIIRNCIIHGDQSRSGAISPIVNSSNGDDLKNVTIVDCRIIGRPIRIPDTYNGVTLNAAGLIDPCNQVCNGMRGSNCNIYRTEYVRQPDGIGLTGVLGNWKIMGNWIHRHAYVEWTTYDSSSGAGGWYPTAAGGSTYTHADCIQFHRGKHIRICGNTLGNYLGGASSGGYTHNATPSQRDAILDCADFYNSNFMIKQEVSSSVSDQIQDVVIWKNFLGGSVATVNWPSSTNGNPFLKRLVQDNWNDATDPGFGIWHNRVRADSASLYEFLIYSTWMDRLVDNLRTDGTPVKITRGG